MPAPLTPFLDRWSGRPPPHLPGRLVVPPGLRAFLLAGLAARDAGPVLALVASDQEAGELHEDVLLFWDRARLLPAWETFPFEHVSPTTATMARRAEARHLLAQGDAGSVVVASVRAATQRVSPSPVEPVVVARGEEIELAQLTGDLASLGYHRTDRVEGRGEFAVRGGLVDVYPAQADHPVRVDFWGDQVESVRAFSVATQRSGDEIGLLTAYPAREVRAGGDVAETARRLLTAEPWAASTWERLAEGATFPGMESWLPWLAPAATALEAMPHGSVVVFDPVRAGDRSRDLVKEEIELAVALAPTWGESAPAAGEHPALYLPLEEALAGRPVLDAPPVPASPDDRKLEVGAIDVRPGDPESIGAALGRLRSEGLDVVVAMDGTTAADRVAGLLGRTGIDLPRTARLERTGSAVIATGIHKGFVAREFGLAVLGEQEIAGRRRAHRRPGRREPGAAGAGYRDLGAGDYVIHHRHGIGRFEGMVTQEMTGIERDYLLIEYAAGDRLYVPTDQLAAVRKYTGGEAPRLSRMGGADWTATRTRVRRALAAVAEQVVALHRERARVGGHAFGADTPWQSEFEASFPFEETPDQLTAIEDVKRDMRADRPMDRLIFGDVGFGKTEVAIRAAFKAVIEGKQVAVLVPTTLLAQQHYATFSDRFDPFPARVEVLSRFLTAAQQRKVLAGLAGGEVDVVIGTHRLLSDDVVFKDLGLLVVDEEQRFGVAAKDRIKALRSSVDVLTLTATPIPRTLEMALTGLREVSRIRTPPQDRQPILTYVGPFDEPTVAAAIRRELLRDGQVFYVHNRISSMDATLARLRDLVPEARYAAAHGRMNEGELEQVMFDFWNRSYDVLVATTIIESGLDLPQVNTLVVERADLLGLAQLYQLRGRVGRSTHRAYAYLFHPPEERLTEEAYRRLEAVGEYTDLGSGFELALRDLEIRGAGSMLGEVQSGHVAAVGLDLYMELVAEAVGELRGTPVESPAGEEVRIDLPVDAHLPETYVADQPARLEAYRRLAAATTAAEVEDVAAEWRDRYGPIPDRAAALLEVARLRVEALRIGLTEVVGLRNEVRLAPVDLTTSQEVRLERLAPKALIRGDVLFVPSPSRTGVVADLTDFLRKMWPPVPE